MRRTLLSAVLVVGLVFLSQANPSPPQIELAFMGDLMLGRGIQQVDDDPASMAAALDYLAPHLQAADLALANLESPLTDAPLLPESRYDLRARPSWADVLRQSGVDVLNLVNNHSLDCGEAGLSDTQNNLAQASLVFISPAASPKIITVRGVKIALLGFQAPFTPQSTVQAIKATQEAKQSAQVVIVSLHWGTELSALPSASQRRLAQQLAEAGADILWGHHPHVLQPVEFIKGEGRTSPTLVMYSLGNALFDQAAYPHATQGALLRVRLAPGSLNGVEAVPFTIDVSQGKIVAPDLEAKHQISASLDLPLKD